MKILEFKRGVWNVLDTETDKRHKFPSEEEAKAFAGVKDAPKESKEFQAKTSWSDGIQQTKAYKESPQKKSHRGGKSWNKD